MTDSSLEQAMQLAMDQHRCGRLADAETIYRRVLAERPNHPDAARLMGVLAGQTGRFNVAIQLLERVVAMQPTHAQALVDLGDVLQAHGKLDEAISAYRHAIRLRPEFAETYNNLGNALGAAGRFPEAAEAYRDSLRLRPNHAPIRSNLGNALGAMGRLDEAIAAYEEALEGDPTHSDAYYNLGNAFIAAGRIVDAIAAYRKAVALAPNHCQAYNNLGNALAQNGSLDDAIHAFHKALEIDAGDAPAESKLGDARRSACYNNLAGVYLAQKRMDEAIAIYRKALSLDPHSIVTLANLGIALEINGFLDEAVVCHQRALEENPNHTQELRNLANARANQRRYAEAFECFDRLLSLDPANPEFLSDRLFHLHYLEEFDAAALLREHRKWNERHAGPLACFIPAHYRKVCSERRLRIGYVSPDFRQHVAGRNFLPLLREHDREHFEIFCYSNVEKPDACTEEIRQLADHWRAIFGVSDEHAAAMVASDQIDILVDLAVHTARNRLLLFARKPAPIQVTYLGYCSTTGMDAMDYRLSDFYLDPPDADLSGYSEKTIRLAHSYWSYQPMGPVPDVAASPAAGCGKITFGSLNKFAKVSEAALDLWLQIIAGVPGSELIFYAQEGSCREEVRQKFERKGISRARLHFVKMQSWEQYIQTWSRIDIALDSFPFGGGITTCDALWMGVPVVTLSGQTAVGRGGRSILSNIGLPEFIAETPEQYVKIAVSLAGDAARLGELRSTLRDRMEHSPVRNPKGHARDVEAAYQEMWRRWCNHEKKE